MGTKTEKRARRLIRKNKKKVALQYVQDHHKAVIWSVMELIYGFKLRDRLRFAWRIIAAGKKQKAEAVRLSAG